MSSIYKRDSLDDKKFPWWNNILRSAKIFWETAAFIPAALCIFLLPFSGGGLLTKVVLRTFFSDVFLRIAIKNASWQNSKNTFWGISQLFCIEIYVFHQDDTWISMREFEMNVHQDFALQSILSLQMKSRLYLQQNCHENTSKYQDLRKGSCSPSN